MLLFFFTKVGKKNEICFWVFAMLSNNQTRGVFTRAESEWWNAGEVPCERPGW